MVYPKIRELRILHDYKQDYVAGKLGMSQPEYSRLENGHRHARIEDFRVLSTLYEVTISSMMMRDNEISYGSVSKDRFAQVMGPGNFQIAPALYQQEELITHILQKQQQTEEYLKSILAAVGLEEGKNRSRKP